MVEPPGDLRRRRIFEIDDGVLVAGKFAFIEQRAGAMQQARVFELRLLADALAIKTAEYRR